MRKVDEDFLYVCGLLNEHGAEYIAGGAVAMGLHGHVRATRDIDVMIPSDLDNTRKVLAALENLPMCSASEIRMAAAPAHDAAMKSPRGASSSASQATISQPWNTTATPTYRTGWRRRPSSAR